MWGVISTHHIGSTSEIVAQGGKSPESRGVTPVAVKFTYIP